MREQRLVFGEVADLYDRYRPSYPDRLIGDLIAIAGLDGSKPVLEVGAGTGKATAMFAARGIPVLAVEPSGEMAAVARRNCRRYPAVEIEQIDFEQWEPRGRRFPLLFSAQAWHWVEPSAGYAKAREALSPQGLFAAFWNRFAWAKSDLREPLLLAYERAVPGHRTDSPMYPGNLDPDAEADWEAEIAEVDGLADAEVRCYGWDEEYSVDYYTGQLATTSDIRLLDEERRAALLAAVAEVIERQGGRVRIPMNTRLCLARRN